MHEVAVTGILSARGGMNLYRGCTHGCIYCDSRSECYRMEHAFEDVAVKHNAPELLRQALRSRKKRCMIATGSMCDPYLPLEQSLGLTRACLEVIAQNGFGATVLTKSDLVLRDLDVLRRIHEESKCVVQMTLTTHDEALCAQLEPGVAGTARRVAALGRLREVGIPTVVWLSPILPFINDTEENLRGILADCAQAGVRGVLCFGMGVTLRAGSRAYFYERLDALFPGVKERYQCTFGERYVCDSPEGGRLMGLFHTLCKNYGMLHDNRQIFAYLQEFTDKHAGKQLCLF